MQETLFLVGKRAYKSKHAAMKALKEFDRRVQRRIEKLKSKQLTEYEIEYDE